MNNMKKSNDVALNYRAYLDKLGCTFRSMEEYDRMLRLCFNNYLDEYTRIDILEKNIEFVEF